MKAVINDLAPEVLDDRHRKGLDRYDEMWEGVLHMNPLPAAEHGRRVVRLVGVLEPYLERHGLGTLYANTGVRDPARPKEDYRGPDLALLAPGREGAIRGGWFEEGPDVVIEVRSPGDETYEKIPFYEARGVGEMVIIEAAEARVEVLRRTGRELRPVSADEAGWLSCRALAVAFQTATTPEGPRVKIRLDRDRTEALL